MTLTQKCAACLLALAAAISHADAPKTASEAEIQAFLASPDVKVFMTRIPGHWRNVRRFIEVGQPIQNGCQFSSTSQTTSGTGQVIQMQMARNRVTCTSLMFEGIDPDAGTQSWLSRLLDGGKIETTPALPPMIIHTDQPH